MEANELQVTEEGVERIETEGGEKEIVIEGGVEKIETEGGVETIEPEGGVETIETEGVEKIEVEVGANNGEQKREELETAEKDVSQEEADTTIHPFNISPMNTTVLEKDCPKSASCEGSDSGVEVIEPCNLQRTISTGEFDADGEHPFDDNFKSLTPAQSCDSSIISCCSNYEDAFNVLVRRNSTLLDDYKLRGVDGTSENGSESSSVASGKCPTKRSCLAVKKKVSLEKAKVRQSLTQAPPRSQKPPMTPRSTSTVGGANIRGKSTDRSTPVKKTPRTKPPDNLSLNLKSNKDKVVEVKKTRTPSQTRSTITTPTDDGRWPSQYSRPAPTMTRSLRGILPPVVDVKPKEVKSTLEKYATLPRRRRERSADPSALAGSTPVAETRPRSRDTSLSRVKSAHTKTVATPPSKNLMQCKQKKVKTKIYHETSSQTALDCADIAKALAGINFNPVNPQDVERQDCTVQVDIPDDKLAKVGEQLAALMAQFEALKAEHAGKCKEVEDVRAELGAERAEKEGLKQELRTNNERVVAMMGGYGNNTDDSDNLQILESRLQRVAQIIIKQEEEISMLNECRRTLQRRCDKADEANRCLLQQHQEHEDLLEFLQIEKTAAADALKDGEVELKRARVQLARVEQELADAHEECKHLVRGNEQRRQENLGAQARYTALEAKCRELLVHQGSTVSGAAVALTSLNARLESLVDQLTTSYNFTDEDLDDVIFHNEAYSNSTSSLDATPDQPRKAFPADKSPSPMAAKPRGSSLIAAVIGAIRNATTTTTHFNRENSRDTLTDNSDSAELLDSETEPCLMMEHVLEDVVVPDSHSVNMVSSGHSMISSLRLSHTESLNSLSQAIRNRERCEAASKTDNTLSDLASPVSLVDQVIDADNLLTRLLKIIRIIQTENEEYMNELQDERDSYAEQNNTHRESNKIVVKQLKDWEALGAKLKCEVKELLAQLSKKNAEIEEVKNELNAQRQEVEKLNRDVCELSTALSKTEVQMKIKDEEAAEALRSWENDGEQPTALLGRLLLLTKEVPALQERLAAKDKQLSELTQEYVANRQVLTENLREAIAEAKKQYNAIDSALETLQSIQSVVQQCPSLLQLQRQLEETSFQSASAMPLVVPPDFNANATAASVLQAIG